MYFRIKKFCEEKNISINQLCKAVNIKPQLITNLKNRTLAGKTACLSAENAAKIADFMGISILELITGEGD